MILTKEKHTELANHLNDIRNWIYDNLPEGFYFDKDYQTNVIDLPVLSVKISRWETETIRGLLDRFLDNDDMFNYNDLIIGLVILQKWETIKADINLALADYNNLKEVIDTFKL